MGFSRYSRRSARSSIPLVWFAFSFLFFSFSKGKKDNYLLPLYPAAALMVGALWDHGLQSEEGRKGFLSGLLLLTLLFFGASVLFLSKIPQRSYPALMDYHSLGLSVLCYLLAGSFFSLVFFIKKRKWASFFSLMTALALFHLHLCFLLPQFDPQRSAKAFSEKNPKKNGGGG